MTDAGEQVLAALELRRKSVESARVSAIALADRRESDTPQASAGTMGNEPADASPIGRTAA